MQGRASHVAQALEGAVARIAEGLARSRAVLWRLAHRFWRSVFNAVFCRLPSFKRNKLVVLCSLLAAFLVQRDARVVEPNSGDALRAEMEAASNASRFFNESMDALFAMSPDELNAVLLLPKVHAETISEYGAAATEADALLMRARNQAASAAADAVAAAEYALSTALHLEATELALERARAVNASLHGELMYTPCTIEGGGRWNTDKLKSNAREDKKLSGAMQSWLGGRGCGRGTPMGSCSCSASVAGTSSAADECSTQIDETSGQSEVAAPGEFRC